MKKKLFIIVACAIFTIGSLQSGIEKNRIKLVEFAKLWSHQTHSFFKNYPYDDSFKELSGKMAMTLHDEHEKIVHTFWEIHKNKDEKKIEALGKEVIRIFYGHVFTTQFGSIIKHLKKNKHITPEAYNAICNDSELYNAVESYAGEKCSLENHGKLFKEVLWEKEKQNTEIIENKSSDAAEKMCALITIVLKKNKQISDFIHLWSKQDDSACYITKNKEYLQKLCPRVLSYLLVQEENEVQKLDTFWKIHDKMEEAKENKDKLNEKELEKEISPIQIELYKANLDLIKIVYDYIFQQSFTSIMKGLVGVKSFSSETLGLIRNNNELSEQIITRVSDKLPIEDYGELFQNILWNPKNTKNLPAAQRLSEIIINLINKNQKKINQVNVKGKSSSLPNVRLLNNKAKNTLSDMSSPLSSNITSFTSISTSSSDDDSSIFNLEDV